MWEGCSLGSCSFWWKFLCGLHLHWSHCWPCHRLQSMEWIWNHPCPAGNKGDLSCRNVNVSVTSGNDFLVSQADYLPSPKKQEVVSHPVNEWNIGSARDVSGPRNAQVAFTLMYWTYFPMPKLIQMAADGYKAINSWKIPIIITRTSVSTVRTKTWLHPLFSACCCVHVAQQFLCRLTHGHIFIYR